MKRILVYLAVLIVASMLPAVVSAQSLTWHDRGFVESTNTPARDPKVAVSGDNVVAVWMQSDGSHDRIYVNNSINRGATWSTARLLENNLLNAANPQVAMSGDNVVAVWEQFDGSRNRIYANHSANGGVTWSGAQVIEPVSTSNGRDPQVAVSGNNVVVVWALDSGSTAHIYANHATFSGATLTWVTGNAGLIEDNVLPATDPQVAMSGNNVVAVWSQSDSTHTRIYSNYSTNAGLNWIGDTLIENTSTLDGGYPKLAVSGNNVVAVWLAWDDNLSLSRVYANRAAFSGSVLTWTPANAVRIDSNGLNCDGVQVAISGSNVVAVWIGYQESPYVSHLYTVRSNDAGSSWNTEQLLVADATISGSSPHVTISGSNVVAVWSQDAAGGNRIYARNSFDGGSNWDSPGFIDTTGDIGGTSPQVAMSGDNVVAVWFGYESSAGVNSIYSNYATVSGGGLIGPGGSGGGGGGCFIATAAFGTPLAKQVEVLRQFRDKYLLTNVPGRKFVSWYYRNGPVAAKFIENRPLARAATQAALYPLIGFSFLLINGFMPFVLAGILMAVLLFFRFRPKKVNAG